MGHSRRFFFALFSFSRCAVSIGFLERPLCVGVLWAVVTGDFVSTLGLALFCELFWLDLFPAGTYIAPNPIAPFLLTLTTVYSLNLQAPAEIAVPLLFSLPAAHICARIEYWQRSLQTANYNKLRPWFAPNSTDVPDTISAESSKSEQSEITPLCTEPPLHAMITRSLLQIFSMQVITFLILFVILQSIMFGLRNVLGYSPYIFGATWLHIWCVGAVGAILGIRLRDAYLFFGVCVIMGIAASLIM